MKTVAAMALMAAALAAAISTTVITPAVETEPQATDVDDPAIWRNPKDPAKSLIVGTIKQAKPAGALVVYTLDGKAVETVSNIDRPNNVDILGDICVTTERLARQLRVYRIGATKPHLTLIGTITVFEGEPEESGAPMGVALYQRRKDKAIFAIVSRKTGPKENYLWQYRLQVSSSSVTATKVRAFGAYSGAGEIEAVAVDHDNERVYYSDEECCVRAYPANPDAKQSEREIARFAETGWVTQREGIAITKKYVIITDQQDPQSEYHVFDKKNLTEIAVWKGQSQSTDGLDAISQYMGPAFPRGFLIAMNSGKHNFHLYRLP
jgi:3-phytase